MVEEDPLERVDSIERVDSAEIQKVILHYDSCPGDLRFVFTFVDNKRLDFDYILKKHKPLPYERELKGG